MQNENASQWREVDIALAGPDLADPYTDIDAWVTFTHSSGRQLRRPVFWDGGAATLWQWRLHPDEPGHGDSFLVFDADGRVPSKYWLIDPRTGRVLKSGDRPPNYVTIEFDRYGPSLLICAETTPAWVMKSERITA